MWKPAAVFFLFLSLHALWAESLPLYGRALQAPPGVNNQDKVLPFARYLTEEELKESYTRNELDHTPRAKWQTFFYSTWFRIRDHFFIHRKSGMTAEERSVIAVYKKTLPCVAQLFVFSEIDEDHEGYKQATQDLTKEEISERFITTVSTGTTILWDDQGHMVTNWHCLYLSGRKVVRLKVLFPRMVDYLDVEIVGSFKSRDLAVLKVSDKQYNPLLANPLRMLPKPIQKGSSKFLQIGQTCLAIGSPGSQPSSMSKGIVQCLDATLPLPAGSGEYQDLRGCIVSSGMSMCLTGFVCIQVYLTK